MNYHHGGAGCVQKKLPFYQNFINIINNACFVVAQYCGGLQIIFNLRNGLDHNWWQSLLKIISFFTFDASNEEREFNEIQPIFELC